MKESKHNNKLKAKYATIRNMKMQRKFLLKELTTDSIAVFKDLDRLEGMFFIQSCEYKVTTKKGDDLNHVCTHGRLYGTGCRLRNCPL